MLDHRVNQAEIELTIGDQARGHALMDRVSYLRERRLEPLMQRVFDELSGADRLDRIGVLELDLGEVSADDFDEDFPRKLESALRGALHRRLGPAPARDAWVAASRELVETFARTGLVPWWADARDADVVNRHVLRLVEEAPAVWQEVVASLAEDEVALRRLTRPRPGLEQRQDTPAILSSPPGPLSNSAASPLRGEGENVPAKGPVPPFQPKVPTTFEPKVPTTFGDGSDLPRSGVDRPLELIRAASMGSSPPLQSASDQPRSGIDRPLELLRVASMASSPPLQSASDQPRSGVDRPSDLLRAASMDQASPLGAPPTPPRSVTLSTHPRIEAARRAALAQFNEVYVHNAGLVLLWPFLERFFTRTGLLDDQRRFLDDAATSLAIALLAWISFEDLEPPEPLLPLTKLLCGLPLEAPIAPSPEPSPDQIAACDRLLSAVISHATVLGEMSTTEFRRTFLVRRAALSVRDGAWLLVVQSQPQDLLLPRFPWSWSWLRLPWMSSPLRVEWS